MSRLLATLPESIAGPAGPETVAAWRLQVLERAFRYMFLLLATILVVEASVSLRSGQWHALPALALGVALQGVAAFARGWSTRARASVFTAAAWLGMGTTLPVLGFGLPIPFIVAGLTLTLLALCVGQRFALVSLGALVALLLAVGCYLSFARPSPLPVALALSQPVLDPNRFSNWVRVAVIFGGIGVALVGAVGFLVQRLEEAVGHNRNLFASLERASQDKIRALEEREALQEKVSRTNELQLLGLLSATVAHDFNNLLMVILGNAAALRAESQGQAKEDLLAIEQAGEQAADLCRRLLTLGRERVSGVEVADLSTLVEGELPILRRLVGANVALTWEKGPELRLKCGRTEMRQILLNLSANARDAMPGGGQLHIATRRVNKSAPGQATASPHACLSVGDDGTGMDAATRARIFEPFFTTKGESGGTGLGMAVVAAAVEQQQGFLELESEPGHGSTFSIYFPLTDAPLARPVTDEAPRRVSPGRETILVVDDDAQVRKMLTRYLEKHGYQVLTARDGDEAIEQLTRTHAIALVVSDAVMPRLGGRELFRWVSAERPTLPFLFCSGFPAGQMPLEVLESSRRALLPKPFSEQALLHQVRRLLELESSPAEPRPGKKPTT